ncbi:cytochrome c oxidase assembly factor CtaG [Aeribacillus composti]|nr:cytochrome c oxidase assembly factor CtaG [Aeribacillus composti]MED0745495.1 cytochrome c oxidase assembly factor CtaG [Aeribacillus composti]
MQLSLDIFGFRAMWSPLFFIFCVILIVLYLLLTDSLRHYFKNSEPVSLKQKLVFILAIVLLYVSKGSPLDLLGHITFTGHMASMAILFLIVAPLLIIGVPEWLWKAVMEKPVIKPFVKFFTKPILAMILFNLFFSLYHVPFIFDTLKSNYIYHEAATTFIFVFAFFMYWPLIGKSPNWHPIGGLKKIAYILGNSVLITPACGLIIFAGAPLFETYSNPEAWVKTLSLCVPSDTLAGLSLSGPQMFSGMPLLEDQQLGGIIMKVIQELVYGTFLAHVFFEWAKKEREKDDIDVQNLSPEPNK